jgi:hypothetical protein
MLLFLVQLSRVPVPMPKSCLGNSVLVPDLHSVTQGYVHVSSFIDHVPVNSVPVPSSTSARYPVAEIPDYLPQENNSEVFSAYNRSIQSSQSVEKTRRTKSSDAQSSAVDIKKKHKSVTFGPVSYIPDVHPSPAIHSVQEAASSTSNLLLLRGHLDTTSVSILIDSGASGLGFVSERLVRRHKLKPISTGFQTQQITLADGSIINSKGCVSAKLTIPATSTNISYSISTQFLVVPLEHDVILGKAWLTMENPDIDWTTNIVNLHKPVPMTLLGEHHQNPKFLISSMQLKKAMNKHQIEQAFFVPVKFNLNELAITEEKVDPKIQNIMNQLQEEYRDVFPDELPKQLPPSREFDHRIELTSEAQPFSRAPYRLSLLEQDELKKQLTEFLECTPSTNGVSEK